MMLAFSPFRLSDAPSRPKRPPRPPQDGPRISPKKTRRRPRGAPRRPTRRPRRPRRPQNRPKRCPRGEARIINSGLPCRETPRRAQEAPKRPLRGNNNCKPSSFRCCQALRLPGPTGPPPTARVGRSALHVLRKIARRGFQRLPTGSRDAQEAPRCPQDGFKRPQDGSRRATRGEPLQHHVCFLALFGILCFPLTTALR